MGGKKEVSKNSLLRWKTLKINYCWALVIGMTWADREPFDYSSGYCIVCSLIRSANSLVVGAPRSHLAATSQRRHASFLEKRTRQDLWRHRVKSDVRFARFIPSWTPGAVGYSRYSNTYFLLNVRREELPVLINRIFHISPNNNPMWDMSMTLFQRFSNYFQLII